MRPGRRWLNRTTVTVVAVSAAAITALTVGGIALADNGAGSGEDPGATTSDERKALPRGWGVRRQGMLGRALHGEFVVESADGDFETVATQHGTVEDVSDSEITVKSDDGYTRTYAVEDDTLVNAQRDGIGSIETGDKVMVAGTVSGETVTAIRVFDVSSHKEMVERFRPGRSHGMGGMWGGGMKDDADR